jgi:hypothetical protein
VSRCHPVAARETLRREPLQNCRRMVVGMNASKNKGDRAELEAVEVLKELAPDLVLIHARRKLGAGRRDDMGDLDVFDDVTVQVKNLKNPVDALREAASGAQVQSDRAQTKWHVGMSPMPRARRDGIRWLCATTQWPTAPCDTLPMFGTTGKALEYIRRDSGSADIFPEERLAVVERRGVAPLFISPVTVWVDALRAARSMAYSLSERSL